MEEASLSAFADRSIERLHDMIVESILRALFFLRPNERFVCIRKNEHRGNWMDSFL